jgi:ribosomal protein L18E
MEFGLIVVIMTIVVMILTILLIFAFKHYNSMILKLINFLKENNSNYIKKIKRLKRQIETMKTGYITARIRGIRDYNKQNEEVVIFPSWIFNEKVLR